MVLTRLNRILAIDPKNRIAVVEPRRGDVRLSAAAAPHGLYYSPDPSSQTALHHRRQRGRERRRAHCLKYGVTATHVLGLEVVLADGQVVELGSPEASRGGPISWPIRGSEEHFGIATRIRVRLLPVPRAIRTLLATFGTLRTRGRGRSRRVIASGIVPAALEMMDQSCINAVEDSVYAAGYPPRCRAVAAGRASTAARGPWRQNAEPRSRHPALRTARVVLKRRRTAKHGAAVAGPQESLRRDGRACLADLGSSRSAVVPRSRTPGRTGSLGRIAAATGSPSATCSTRETANLHPNISFDGRCPAIKRAWNQASGKIHAWQSRRGGTNHG